MSGSVARDPEQGDVVALNHDGDGVVKAGKTAFVGGALPGETIRFRRVRRHRQYDEAQLLEVIAAAPERTAPACAHFGVCGGCALQHLDPAAQRVTRQAELAGALERIGRVQPEAWLPALPGPTTGYRRRARLGARWVSKKGRVVVGFRERLAPYVAALDACPVLDPAASRLIAPLATLLGGLSIRERVPQIEVAVGEGERDEAVVALVLRVLAPPSADDRVRLLAFEQEWGADLYLQPAGPDSVAPLGASARPLRYVLPEFGVSLAFRPTDFIQVNGAVNRALVARVVDLLGPDAGDHVVDLFCGLGNFTLPLATRAGAVTGVEGEPGLVARAVANAGHNALPRARFHVADLAAEDAGGAAWAREQCTLAMLDPPRAGARAVLPVLARLAPRRIVYVSCHPGSLARDAGELVHGYGFRLRSAGIVDMFPHTAHVESLAVFEPG